jgi:YidC/Oxa1 family membrane protein insertase
MMMFMPLIFGVIMKDLPSGLSLYIFVSTMLGIIQQIIVFKRIN